MKLCFALFHYDLADTDPAPFLERAPLMRHLPQEVAALGHKVDVVILFPTSHTFEERGVRYHFVSSGYLSRRLARRAGRWIDRHPASMEPAFRAVRTIRALHPDLIHLHGSNLYLNHGLLSARLGRRRPPFVMHYHGGNPSPHRPARRLQRYIFHRVARFLFTTPTHARPFIDAGLIDALHRVVPFMETSSTFRPRPRAEARRQTGMTGDPVFLWAGRLAPGKDPMTALLGFEKILLARPNAHLYLHYLTDELLPDLRQYVGAHPSLKAHVHFRGRAPLEQMEILHNSADFLLQTSLHEFSGIAVLEALACGVLPVVTDIPSFHAMTDAGRHGVLFPPGDAEALARGVLAVPPEEIAARSRQVRAWFEHAFSFPALARQLDTVYREVRAESTS
ncbi:MAG: glycosyltransferase family 4 protein [Rhodothermales bacterium]